MRLGQHMTEEQRAQSSIAHMGHAPTGPKHHTAETRAKMSVAVKKAWDRPEVKAKMSIVCHERIITPETRTKMAASMMGHVTSQETRAKISLASSNLSPETRTKMSVAASNRSPETKAKLSAAGIGHSVSPETRAKISAACKERVGPLSSQWRGGKKISNAKKSARHRTLGFTPLNSYFVGCEGHHINKSDVIYLPRKLHRSVSHNQWTGQGMAAMNALAGKYLMENWT